MASVTYLAWYMFLGNIQDLPHFENNLGNNAQFLTSEVRRYFLTIEIASTDWR